MKHPALCFLVLTWAWVVHAQGTVNFLNLTAPVGLNAPVYESDGVTPLSGNQYLAELLAGPNASNLASIATTGFLRGQSAGYFSGGTQYINSVVPGTTAWVQVDVWNTASGATFDQAKASGLPNSWWQSSVFTVVTGGGFQGPPPAYLTGLGTSPVYLNGVPEPSAQSLVSLSAALVVLRKLLNKSMMTNRRRKTPLDPKGKFGGCLHAPVLFPATFAYLSR